MKATKQAQPAEPEPLANAVWLPRERIRPNPDQPRQMFDSAELAGLAASIQQFGVLQPLVVRYEPSRYDATPYILVSGERRFRASEGIKEKLPCIISDVDESTARLLALTENIQRQDLTAMEEARAIAELMTEQSLSARRVARVLHVSDGWINNRLALLKTGADVQEVAARVPYAMSSLLLIDTVKDDAQERQELLELVENGAPHSAIKSRIDEIANLRKLTKSANHAPDAETQRRSTLHSRNHGGNVSRGRIVQGTSPKEATAQVESTVSEIERHLRTLEAWKAHCPAKQFARAVSRIVAQLERLTDE
jgi:ParB family chromosome partitioning protein